jgi:arylsulfatase
VYPLLPKTAQFPTPQRFGKTTFTYYEGTERIPSVVAANVSGHAYTLTADVDVPVSGADGVIFSQGSRYGGTTLYVNDNRMIYEINAYGNRSGQIVASDPLPLGKSHIVVEATPEFASTRQTPSGAAQGSPGYGNSHHQQQGRRHRAVPERECAY